MKKFSLKLRFSQEEVMALSEKVAESPVSLNILNSIPNPILLLSQTRQIIFANNALSEYLDGKDNSSIIGLRIGEVFSCTHSGETVHGCGNSKACKTCGAFFATANAVNKKDAVKDYFIYNTEQKEAFYFRVSASLFEVEKQSVVLFSLNEINSEKRKKALERVFFHDINNIAAGLCGILEVLKTDLPPEFNTYTGYLAKLSARLVDEIAAQKQLMAMENKELYVLKETLVSISVLQDVIDLYLQYDISKNKEIILDANSDCFNFISDKAILGRVLSNLLKNALEASSQDKVITLGSNDLGDSYQFWVNNQSYIEKEIQLQIFNRSVSTKGKGRGIGTFSVKLLTEDYLRGKASFVSNKEEGTTFFIKLPKAMPND